MSDPMWETKMCTRSAKSGYAASIQKIVLVAIYNIAADDWIENNAKAQH